MASSVANHRGYKVFEKCALFSSLDENARRKIATYAVSRSFSAGNSICRHGDHGDSMMAVVVGTVRISLPTVRGKEIILADLRPGELFGEIALLDGRPRSANATALTNCQLMVLARRDVLSFLETNPAACMKLMEILCARIRRSDERMADIAFFNLPVRLAKILLSYQPQGPAADETFALPRRIGGNGRRNTREGQSLSSRLAASGHSGLEEPLDDHS